MVYKIHFFSNGREYTFFPMFWGKKMCILDHWKKNNEIRKFRIFPNIVLNINVSGSMWCMACLGTKIQNKKPEILKFRQQIGSKKAEISECGFFFQFKKCEHSFFNLFRNFSVRRIRAGIIVCKYAKVKIQKLLSRVCLLRAQNSNSITMFGFHEN